MSSDATGYIEKQGSPQREILGRLRGIILRVAPEANERLWMGVPWYGKCYLVALKDHVNMGFSVEGLSGEEMLLLEGKGKFMRHLKFRTLEDVDEAKVERLLRLVSRKGKGC